MELVHPFTNTSPSSEQNCRSSSDQRQSDDRIDDGCGSTFGHHAVQQFAESRPSCTSEHPNHQKHAAYGHCSINDVFSDLGVRTGG